MQLEKYFISFKIKAITLL